MIITIDGPVGSGKSTAAQILAKKLGFYYLNSGLLYRALAYLLVTHESYTIKELAHPRIEHLAMYLDDMRLAYHYDDDGSARIMFDDQNITAHLKNASMDQYASILSTNENVRDALLDVQQKIGKHYDLVVEGRDSGSVVFPQADHKFFLTASLQERARRWQGMQEKRGVMYTFEQAIQALKERDTRDQERAIAPLCIPVGAIVIDSTDFNLDQVVQEIMKHI